MARSVIASSTVIGRRSPEPFPTASPSSDPAAYTMGQACPSDSTSRSAVGLAGSDGSNRMCPYINAATIWAKLDAEVGCPESAAAVISTDSRLRSIAFA